MRISVNILDLSMKSREIEVSCIVIHDWLISCLNQIKQEIYRKRVRISSKTLEKANKSNKCIFLPFCLEITLTVVKINNER